MTPILHLTLRSVRNRGLTVALTLISIALSVTLLLGVERLRHDARVSFASTISGTDLIVGARGGPVPLLLYSVFRIGNATSNIRFESVEMLRALRGVAWVVPLSLGDSHRGYRVLGTDAGYFRHVRYGNERSLALAYGRVFAGGGDNVLEAVLGAEVADALGYRVGSRIVLAHGAGEVSFVEHADKPFTVVGILARTGTPIDRTVHVSLEAIDAIHAGWETGATTPGALPGAGADRSDPLGMAPRGDGADRVPPTANPSRRSVTAALVGLKSRAAVFGVQRHVNAYPDEPLLAILPGATLHELWDMISIAERALLAVSALVVMVGLSGLVAVMIAGLGARRRELAILRALGAGPWHVFLLLASETLLVTAGGCLAGLALLYAGVAVLGPWAEAEWGFVLSLGMPAAREWRLLGLVMCAGLAASLVPAWHAYRLSLADGMMVRA